MLCSRHDSGRALPGHIISSLLLSSTLTGSGSCLPISAAFTAVVVKAAEKENFSPHSTAEAAHGQPPIGAGAATSLEAAEFRPAGERR